MENKIEITKQNVKEIFEKQTNQLLFEVVYKDSVWKVGTKDDPKKEWGSLKLSVIVPNGEDSYVKDIDFFLNDKTQLPSKKLERFSKCYALFEFNRFNPEVGGRFVKIIE